MIKVSNRPFTEATGDTAVCFVFQGKRNQKFSSDRAINSYLQMAVESGDFEGKEEQVLKFYRSVSAVKSKKKKVERVLVVGLGKDTPDHEVFRKAAATAAVLAVKTKASVIRAELPSCNDYSDVEIARVIAEGFILGSYRFDKYKKNDDPDNTPGKVKSLTLHCENAAKVREAVKIGVLIAESVCLARDMANEPGNYLTPEHFAKSGRAIARKHGLKCKVMNKAAMKIMGMGGILAVSQGSGQSPRLVTLEYVTGKNSPTLLLVGKGLTFDSGGISLKPGIGMEEMKFDMCGGAAVLSTMKAIGELKPDGVNVIGIVPATENLPGPDALKPGDIITHHNGKTVEVINTDAEGRLILADALSYGIKTYKPDAVIDLATLTGAVIIGLGHHLTGLMSNNDDLARSLLECGERTGEQMWRLPLGKDYRKQLDSQVADLKNIGGKTAGTVTAACFLQEFVGDTPWAHLDIAGTAWNYTKKSYVPKGPSGIGVRTLVDLVMNWPKK